MCSIVVALTAVGAPVWAESPRRSTPAPAQAPDPGYSQYLDKARGIKFLYPDAWTLGEPRDTGWIEFTLLGPPSEPGDPKSSVKTGIEIAVSHQPVKSCIAGRETLAVPGFEGRAVYVYTGGQGDNATICLALGAEWSALINEWPGFADETGLKRLMSSLTVLGQNGSRLSE